MLPATSPFPLLQTHHSRNFVILSAARDLLLLLVSRHGVRDLVGVTDKLLVHRIGQMSLPVAAEPGVAGYAQEQRGDAEGHRPSRQGSSLRVGAPAPQRHWRG